MTSGQLQIDSHGKIVIGGELFEVRQQEPTAIPFDGFVDTGCTYDIVVPRSMADSVCAQVERLTTVSGGAGGPIEGTIRKVNIRLGKLEAIGILAFVPNAQSERVLLGVGLMQKMNVFLGIDFYSGTTQGCILTSDRSIPFLIGKVLHCLEVHDKEIVPRGPCEFCGQSGNLK